MTSDLLAPLIAYQTLMDAAEAIQALHPGEVKNSVLFLQARAKGIWDEYMQEVGNMSSSNLDLDALDAVAAAATEGPWEWDNSEPDDGTMGCGQVFTFSPKFGVAPIAMPSGDCYPRGGYKPQEDMIHIATFDPPTVRALIERLRKAEELSAHWKECYLKADLMVHGLTRPIG